MTHNQGVDRLDPRCGGKPVSSSHPRWRQQGFLRAAVGRGHSRYDSWRGIVSYEPTELVVVARAGTPLAELEATLREKASACPSSRRISVAEQPSAAWSLPAFRAAPQCRRCCSRLRAGREDARWQRRVAGIFGGQVMKNVAGYDVPRAMAGSLGTLGLMTELAEGAAAAAGPA